MSSRARLFGQFQWPAGIAILYVIFKACQFKSINEKVGILEEAWNFFLENFVVVFLAVAPTLFLITMLEALISPILMGFWNRRLSSKVKLLQDNGDNDLARSLAGRAMTWPVLLRAYLVFLGVGLTFSLIGYVVQQTTTARATATVPANAVAPATKALASNSASGVKANDDQANDDQANDDQPGGVKAGDDQAGDDQAGDAKAGREGTRVEIFPLPGSGNLNALFLWSFSIVGVFFLIDWFTSFISFMFGFENRDVAYLEEVRKN